MEKDLLDSDKQLLLVDICARLPYGVILKTDNVFPQKLEGISFDKDTFVFLVSDGGFTLDYMDCKPYLFPLSSMTEEQREEYHSFFVQSQRDFITPNNAVKLFDWLLKNHFDYRGLIEKGLAIDATGLNIY